MVNRSRNIFWLTPILYLFMLFVEENLDDFRQC